MLAQICAVVSAILLLAVEAAPAGKIGNSEERQYNPAKLVGVAVQIPNTSKVVQVPRSSRVPCSSKTTTEELNEWMREQQEKAAIEDRKETELLNEKMRAMQASEKEAQDALTKSQAAKEMMKAAEEAQEQREAAEAQAAYERAVNDAANLAQINEQRKLAAEMMEATRDLNRLQRALQEIENKLAVARQMWDNAQQRYTQARQHPDATSSTPAILAAMKEMEAQESLIAQLESEVPAAQARIAPAQLRLDEISELILGRDDEGEADSSPEASMEAEDDFPLEASPESVEETPMPTVTEIEGDVRK